MTNKSSVIIAIVTTIGTIITGFFAITPLILEHYQVVTDGTIEAAVDNAVDDLSERNAERIDSVIEAGTVQFQNVYQVIGTIQSKSGNKMYAVTIRIDDSTKTAYYRATDNQLQPAWWKDEYKWWIYTDLRDGELHPILFEDKITLEEMRYRANLLYNKDFLKQQVIKIHQEIQH